MTTKKKIPWGLTIKAILVFCAIYAILIYNFGWQTGSIAFGGFMILFLISTGVVFLFKR